MKRYINMMLVTLGLAGVVLSVLPVSSASAINVFRGCNGNGSTEVCQARNRDGVNTIVQNVINVLFFISSIIAVIMIIVGGIKYVTSNGDASKVTSAKNTILYSIVGLVIVLLSYAIVRFVLVQFG